MGMIDRFLGAGATVTAVGNAAAGVAGILTPSATRRMELDEEAYARAIGEQQAEFAASSGNWFDALMNGLNRLPRPLLTLGTIGLFVYAMTDPTGFSTRMHGLALVPEPLWWLMGAIVSFYFGAREAHYFRRRVWPGTTVRTQVVGRAATEWRAPVIGPDEAEDADGWRAPVLPDAVLPSGTVIAEVEHRADPDPAAPTNAPARAPADVTDDFVDDFPDNAALREWAALRAPS